MSIKRVGGNRVGGSCCEVRQIQNVVYPMSGKNVLFQAVNPLLMGATMGYFHAHCSRY